MKRYLYLSLIPEALIVSQLPPEDFGNYFAVGSKKRSRGQAVFFEVDSTKLGSEFDLSDAEQRCVTHDNGRPRKSIYAAIYRVLENVPLDALKKLYLATADGRVLAISPAEYTRQEKPKLHLYQEIAPVTPMIVSKLDPIEFWKSITDPNHPISVPTICFCDLSLGKLATNPDSDDIGDLPYPNIGHLRDCLKELESNPEKETKGVDRGSGPEMHYRIVQNGFFIGNQNDLSYYPLPSKSSLEREYYEWWRSAQHYH